MVIMIKFNISTCLQKIMYHVTYLRVNNKYLMYNIIVTFMVKNNFLIKIGLYRTCIDIRRRVLRFFTVTRYCKFLRSYMSF